MAMKVYLCCVFLLCLGTPAVADPDDCPEVFCFVPCEFGYRTTDNECLTCSCNPRPTQSVQQPVCPDLRCLIPCAPGYQLDQSDCLSCTCAPDSAVEATIPGFGGASDTCYRTKCLIACDNGYETDSEGCPTCVCREGVGGLTGATSNAEIKQAPADKQILPKWLENMLLLFRLR